MSTQILQFVNLVCCYLDIQVWKTPTNNNRRIETSILVFVFSNIGCGDLFIRQVQRMVIFFVLVMGNIRVDEISEVNKGKVEIDFALVE